MLSKVIEGCSSEAAAFLCRENDGLWIGVERSLDNGYGIVFVTNAQGVLLGQATMDAMRQCILKGAHLSDVKMADIMSPAQSDNARATTVPILDERGHVIGVRIRSEKAFLPVAEPDLTHKELRNLLDAYLSTWISSTGEYLTSFEKRFAEIVGMSYGVATSNGTVSLQLALAALGIGEGDEVIVPDLTFAASANSVIHAGARPIFVDVDPTTWCISPEGIEAAITPRTRAVMPVHVFGRPAPMTEIRALAKSHGLFVIEDCAEAHGARYDGQPVGSFSDISSFSFFANKIITTGEGGLCLTNDPDLAVRMRVLRDHGMRPDRRYWHEEPGFNFRMTNMQAAVGCAQVDRMRELLGMRRAVHASYEVAFDGMAGVELAPPLSPRFEPVVWFSCALVAADKRAALIEACRRSNIDLRPFFHNLSAMPAFSRFARECPASSSLSARGINLPTSRKITPEVAERIASVIREALESA
jgi:perosamine synthetase